MSLSPGQRIELLMMTDDPCPVQAGTQGTAMQVCPQNGWTQVWVDWDDGRRLAMSVPPDKYRVVGDLKKPEDFFTNPKPSTMMDEARERIESEEGFEAH